MKIGIAALWLVLTAFPAAGATIYDINFTTTSGAPTPISGRFEWDGTVFTNFIVTWNSVAFNLTASANAPAIIGGTGCPGEASTPAYAFAMLQQSCAGPTYAWSASSSGLISFLAFAQNSNSINGLIFGTAPAASAAGTFSISQVPEPATVGLSLAGLALMFGKAWHQKRRKSDNTVVTQTCG